MPPFNPPGGTSGSGNSTQSGNHSDKPKVTLPAPARSEAQRQAAYKAVGAAFKFASDSRRDAAKD